MERSLATKVLIVGAGPAGCAAAIACCQTGLDVILLDNYPEPRVGPGETLHPGTEVIFRKLGVWAEVLKAGFHRHRGIWRENHGRRVFESYGRDSRGQWL